MSSPWITGVAALWLGMLAVGFPTVGMGFFHYEARQTHPLERGLDGATLLALNSDEGRLAVLRCDGDAQDRPWLIAEIPVGLGPVSVRARTADEVWVVNEVSDSLSIVSLSCNLVVATLPCPDEPADVVFASGRAYVSCAGNRLLRVFDAESRTELAAIPLAGHSPRALAVDPAGARVVVAFLHSGNGTTVLPSSVASAPETPWNPALPSAPTTALIVDTSDPRIAYHVLDHDLAVISTGSPGHVDYFTGIGTSLFTIAARPGTAEWWVGNTEANNRTRYEPNLKGRFAIHRLTRLQWATGERSFLDLSPFDEQGRPNQPGGEERSVAQPMSLAFSADGADVWVAGFASDRVVRISAADGAVQRLVDLRPPGSGRPSMRGPRGLVWDERAERLYVYNKLSATLSVVDTQRASVLTEVRLTTVDVLSLSARAGRELLFDARLSGNGAMSCGTCHIDADLDGLAWDLGDPSGSMTNVPGANLAVHDPTPRDRAMHPMKGPMVTQSLRGLEPGQRLHWRGDRATLHDFNPTFRDLLGGPLREAAEIEALGDYLGGLKNHPNPNRLPDNSLPESFAGGNAVRGERLFAAHLHHCAVCHVLPEGTDHNIDDPRNLRLLQPLKNPALRTTYQRALLDTRPGATNWTGFGLLHDGTGGLQALPTVHFYDLDALSGTQFADVASYVLCFDSGTAPVVGRAVTLTEADRGSVSVIQQIELLESQAAKADTCDLIGRGRLGGTFVNLRFDPREARYGAETSGPLWSRAELLSMLVPGDAWTLIATPPDSGLRLSVDRDNNAVPDHLEPRPSLEIRHGPSGWVVRWPKNSPGWVLEAAHDLRGSWRIATDGGASSEGFGEFPVASVTPNGFFRLRRTW
jgi:hypothetical protein